MSSLIIWLLSVCSPNQIFAMSKQAVSATFTNRSVCRNLLKREKFAARVAKKIMENQFSVVEKTVPSYSKIGKLGPCFGN
jgi:hypothetical protein